MIALVLLLGGVAAGALGALAGIGGGILLVPLMTLLGVPFPIAVATSLVAVIATSTGSATRYLADDLVDVRLGIQLETATVAGAIGGAFVAPFVPIDMLRIVFGLLALYLAASQVREARAGRAEAPSSGYVPRRMVAGVVASALAGVISALLGIGGGAVKVPVMNMVMGVPFRVAAATSNYMIGVTASAGALLYFRRGQIDLAIAAPAIAGVLAGASLGSRLMPKVPVARLRVLFAALLLAIAVQMIRRGWAGEP